MADPTTASFKSRWHSRFEGRLITREDSEYYEFRRIWNGMIDRRPAIIASCLTPHDIRTAVNSPAPNDYPSVYVVAGTVLQVTPCATAGR